MMPGQPHPGVNTLYDARRKDWGRSFRLRKGARPVTGCGETAQKSLLGFLIERVEPDAPSRPDEGAGGVALRLGRRQQPLVQPVEQPPAPKVEPKVEPKPEPKPQPRSSPNPRRRLNRRMRTTASRDS